MGDTEAASRVLGTRGRQVDPNLPGVGFAAIFNGANVSKGTLRMPVCFVEVANLFCATVPGTLRYPA
jgi:hypothetical protein